MTDAAWPSTKALSVFNALSQSCVDMTQAGILDYLRAVWDPKMAPEYVAEGVEYLVAQKWVRIDGDVVRIDRGPNRKGRLVVRAEEDRSLRMLAHWSP